MSNIDKHANNIHEEIRTWGVLHSQKVDKLSVDVQTLKGQGSYKGSVLYSSYMMNLLIDHCMTVDSKY